jgi:hypothetical protein
MESACRRAPWLIIKNLDQDERGHQDRCRTTSMTICGQHLDEGDARQEVPITEAEIEVFEAWFGDLFDELFSTRH